MRTPGARLVASVGVLASFVLGGVVASPALASCAGRTAAQVMADSDVVITGRLVAVDDPGGNVSPHDLAWTVEVSAVHKGQAPATAHVVATEYSHEDVAEGTAYVFALHSTGGTLRAEGCQDLAAVGTSDAAAYTDAAGVGRPPVADGTSLPRGTAPDLTGSALPMPATLLVVAAVLGLGLALRGGVSTRRRRHRAGGTSGR